MSTHSQKFLFGAILFFLAGSIRFLATGHYIVDENYPTFWISILISVLITGSVISISLGSLQLIKNSTSSVKFDWKIILALILFIACPPLLTNDLFSYLYYGEFVSMGHDPYSYTTINTYSIANKYYSTVSPLYRGDPSMYGPLMVLSFIVPASLPWVWSSLLLTKLIILCFTILLFREARRYPHIVPFLFSTVILLEILGQGHNDIIPVFFVFMAIHHALKKNVVFTSIFSVLALTSKVLYFPFVIIAGVILLQADYKKSLKWLGVVISAIALWLLVHPSSLLMPMQIAASLRPSGSWADFFYEINSAIAVINPAHPQLIVRSLQVLAIVICIVIWSIFLARNGGLKRNNFRLIFGLFILTYFVFFIHRFYPWYMIFGLPLLLVIPDMNRKWWIFASASFTLQGLVHQFTPGSSPALVVIVITTGATLILNTIWLFSSVRAVLPMMNKASVPVFKS